MNILGVIPARYNSSRFPGKPLAEICGKPMLAMVAAQVKQAKKLTDYVVATDDERIFAMCKEYDIPVIITNPAHLTAANRMREVSEKISADFYVTINGDEPLINPNNIDAVIPEKIVFEIEFGTNIITPIKNPVELMDSSNIKVVFAENYDAIYMSRNVIPFPYKQLDFVYYKHVGIIGYNKKMLDFYNNSKPGRLELIEGIDTLRFIDYQKQLKLICVDDGFSLSVDTPQDLIVVENFMKANKL